MHRTKKACIGTVFAMAFVTCNGDTSLHTKRDFQSRVGMGDVHLYEMQAKNVRASMGDLRIHESKKK